MTVRPPPVSPHALRWLEGKQLPHSQPDPVLLRDWLLDTGSLTRRVQQPCVRPGQSQYVAAVQGLKRRPAEIWGRRSVFRLGGKPQLVSEFFLMNTLS